VIFPGVQHSEVARCLDDLHFPEVVLKGCELTVLSP